MDTDVASKITVFVSSVQNREVEDMEAERATVVTTITNYSPTVAWAFEYTPASDLLAEEYFLRGVRDCDLFLLVLGCQIAEAVRKEYDEAARVKKPIFAFVKDTQRTEETEAFLNLIRDQSKYATFKTPQDLAARVESSLNSFLLRLVKDDQRQKEYPEVIRALAETKFALPLQEYARQLLAGTSSSFEAEIIHYLNLVPESLREVSKFYVPLRTRVDSGASETLDNMLAKYRRVALVGPAGSGKTTELLNLAICLSKRAIEEPESRQIPVYVNMKYWIEGDVISQLQDVLKGYGLHFERPTVDSVLRDYKIVLLFDGLDEVPPLELPEKVSQIKAASMTYEGVQIVVSCRTTRYASDLGFPVVYLEPLQDGDIIRYMGEFTRSEFTSGRFYSWPSSLRNLSRHPLMLSFIANIATEGVDAPSSLADIYEKYIDSLFERWERAKGARVDPMWKRKALMTLAIHMQRRSHYSVSVDEAISLFREVVSGEHVDFSSVDLLNELVSSGIIKKEGNRYTFWHASFREYLASQVLIDKIRAGETISQFVSDSEWEPVAIFASGLFDDSAEMSRFLFEVLDVDLYLYIRCLANAISAPRFVSALSDDELTHVILREMLEARDRIIGRWFPALLPVFRPYAYHGRGSQLAVVGRFSSEGGGRLRYGYATEEKLGNKVCLLSDLPAGTTLHSLLNAGLLIFRADRSLPLNEAGVLGGHKIALEDIWKELEDIIENKRLVEPLRLMYEQTQAEVHSLVKNRVLPISIPADVSSTEAEVAKLIAGYGTSRVLLQVARVSIDLNDLLQRLSSLAKSGCTSIGESLLPQTDRRPVGSGWITQYYEDKTLIEYVRLYFHHFLEGYLELVQLNFPQLSQRLQFYQLLPVRVVAEIERPAPSKDVKSIGGCDYYFEPLEGTSQNEVVVSLNQKISAFLSPSSNLQGAMETWLSKLKRYGRCNSSTTVWIDLAMLSTFFGEHNQIRHGVYERILNDLREVFKVQQFRL